MYYFFLYRFLVICQTEAKSKDFSLGIERPKTSILKDAAKEYPWVQDTQGETGMKETNIKC